MNKDWVAGILEGEGSFIINWSVTKSGKQYPNFSVSCTMTDEDVILRLYQETGVGHIRGPYVDNPRYKPYWQWRLTKRNDVSALCTEILPVMGLRRSAKIGEILMLSAAHPKKQWSHGVSGYSYAKCRCDICRTAKSVYGKIKYYQRKEMVA